MGNQSNIDRNIRAFKETQESSQRHTIVSMSILYLHL